MPLQVNLLVMQDILSVSLDTMLDLLFIPFSVQLKSN